MALSAFPAIGAGPPKYILDASLYPYLTDVKRDVDFTITLNADLPGRFSYFSFTNFMGFLSDGPAVLSRSEQNLRYSLFDSLPADLAIQGVLQRGQKNPYAQIGLSFRINETPALKGLFDKIGMKYRLSVYPVRLGANNPGGLGLEHAFRWTLPSADRRLYLGGFIDQSFGERLPPNFPKHPIVAEAQIGVRLIHQLHAVAEYRINQRRLGHEGNFALGVQYVLRF